MRGCARCRPGGGIAAELSGARDPRESEWAGGGGVCDAVQQQGGAGGGVGDAGANQRRETEDHAGSGQGISGRAVHRRVASAASGAARGRVRGPVATLAELAAGRGAGRSRISAKSKETKTSGASVRLDPTRGGNAADEVSRTTAGGMDVPVGSGGIEPATHEASAAATGVVHRDGCVHRSKKQPENTKSGRDSTRKNNSGKTGREKHLIFSQPVKPCRMA